MGTRKNYYRMMFIAAAIMAADRGAQIIRVHDVPETVDALKLWEALQDE